MALPGLYFLSFFIEFVFPLWASCRALFEKRQLKDTQVIETDLTQWTVYWIIYVLYNVMEHSFLFFLPMYLPLYGETKLILFAWLIHPETQGAAWIWFNLLEKSFKKADDLIVDFTETRFQSLMAFALGHKADTSKSEKFVSSRTKSVFPHSTVQQQQQNFPKQQ